MSMDNMGKPIPNERRDRADDMLKSIGVSKGLFRWDCIKTVAEQLERDNPQKAMIIAMKYTDLTGAYRLFAELLTEPNNPQ